MRIFLRLYDTILRNQPHLDWGDFYQYFLADAIREIGCLTQKIISVNQG